MTGVCPALPPGGAVRPVTACPRRMRWSCPGAGSGRRDAGGVRLWAHGVVRSVKSKARRWGGGRSWHAPRSEPGGGVRPILRCTPRAALQPVVPAAIRRARAPAPASPMDRARRPAARRCGSPPPGACSSWRAGGKARRRGASSDAIPKAQAFVRARRRKIDDHVEATGEGAVDAAAIVARQHDDAWVLFNAREEEVGEHVGVTFRRSPCPLLRRPKASASSISRITSSAAASSSRRPRFFSDSPMSCSSPRTGPRAKSGAPRMVASRHAASVLPAPLSPPNNARTPRAGSTDCCRGRPRRFALAGSAATGPRNARAGRQAAPAHRGALRVPPAARAGAGARCQAGAPSAG